MFVGPASKEKTIAIAKKIASPAQKYTVPPVFGVAHDGHFEVPFCRASYQKILNLFAR
jgi:hypothetical protein